MESSVYISALSFWDTISSFLSQPRDLSWHSTQWVRSKEYFHPGFVSTKVYLGIFPNQQLNQPERQTVFQFYLPQMMKSSTHSSVPHRPSPAGSSTTMTTVTWPITRRGAMINLNYRSYINCPWRMDQVYLYIDYPQKVEITLNSYVLIQNFMMTSDLRKP